VGYSVGIGGTMTVVQRLMAEGVWLWIVILLVLFAAVQVQLELRRREEWQRERLMMQLGIARSSGRGKMID